MKKNNIFNQVAMSMVPTNRFDLSHDLKVSFSMGELVPTLVVEALPGDVFNINVENMLRFAPLIAPIMHRVEITTHLFFVPNRLLWPDFPKYLTGELDVQHPRITLGPSDYSTVLTGSIADHMGIPPGEYTANHRINPLPFLAYQMIWDEFYRDQDLQNERYVGPAVPGEQVSDFSEFFIDNGLYRRAWERDYFTSARPFAQKGDSVQIPLIEPQTDISVLPRTGIDTPGFIDPVTGVASPNGAVTHSGGDLLVNGVNAMFDPKQTLYIDGDAIQAQATDIITLRRAFKLQEWLEKNARAGTRWIEHLAAHWGVRSSDARLQRPEYIGGARQNMVISEVLATAQNSDDGVAVGTMAGHGISAGGSNSFNHRCEEHGWIIGLISVRPQTAYQDGIHRQWYRQDKLDYAFPTFANIGEQEVLNREVRVFHAQPTGTFGYQMRYGEYKYLNSRVAGAFRNQLDYWHLGRQFATDPALNSLFVECLPDARIFAVTDPEEDHIFAHIVNHVSAKRKLPRFGIPSL